MMIRTLPMLFCALASSLTLSCATSIPVKDAAATLSDSAHPVIMIQYRVSSKKEGSHSLYFRDSAGKQYRVTLPKTSTPEEGAVFELPVQGAVRLVKFSHPDASLPIDVERFFPVFHPEKGLINHIGFLSFKLEPDALFVSPIKRDEAAELLKRALKKYRLSETGIVNAYTGKPIPAHIDTGVLQYQYVSTKTASIEFEDKVWACHTEEQKRNLIVMGTLRFLVSVDKGKINDVKVLRSEHSATQDFETCAERMIRQAEVSPSSFKADLPVIF